MFDARGVYHSYAGFNSDDPYEIEADHFAAALLMPDGLFTGAVERAGDGLAAIEELAELCVTSLTATAIRFALCSEAVTAIVLSKGKRVDYCFMSKPLMEIAGGNRIEKGDPVPPGTPTSSLNGNEDRVKRAEREHGTSELQDWIGGWHQVEMNEEVVGLGSYGKTLTVLTAVDAVDVEGLEEEDRLVESWTPRFRR